MYNGSANQLISTLKGSAANDQIGDSGSAVVGTSNVVVMSRSWNGGAGAVTWCDGSVPVTGELSSANSLVGSVANSFIGSDIRYLPSGNQQPVDIRKLESGIYFLEIEQNRKVETRTFIKD
ncbi:hypothetical protein LZD49_27045 [Dyadobacter sp. CY261]|uniref:hypothetical protein n=1 Tax=Dyadobacter sp. CY261 TaxID=2907203 RepID=UPI001F334D64|nr:hypothetical protein [Dyadobacter sp. CY261]MCF0074170.1 hypothetical protein [Dyadobacter sp. CY261]